MAAVLRGTKVIHAQVKEPEEGEIKEHRVDAIAVQAQTTEVERGDMARGVGAADALPDTTVRASLPRRKSGEGVWCVKVGVVEVERLLEFKQSVSLICTAYGRSRAVSEIALSKGAGGDEQVELYKTEQQCQADGSHALKPGNKRMRERGCASKDLRLYIVYVLPSRWILKSIGLKCLIEISKSSVLAHTGGHVAH